MVRMTKREKIRQAYEHLAVGRRIVAIEWDDRAVDATGEIKAIVLDSGAKLVFEGSEQLGDDFVNVSYEPPPLPSGEV